MKNHGFPETMFLLDETRRRMLVICLSLIATDSFVTGRTPFVASVAGSVGACTSAKNATGVTMAFSSRQAGLISTFARGAGMKIRFVQTATERASSLFRDRMLRKNRSTRSWLRWRLVQVVRLLRCSSRRSQQTPTSGRARSAAASGTDNVYATIQCLKYRSRTVAINPWIYGAKKLQPKQSLRQ